MWRGEGTLTPRDGAAGHEVPSDGGPHSSAGDRGVERLGCHQAIVRHELGRFGGDEIDTAGDRFFATFDGPARAPIAP